MYAVIEAGGSQHRVSEGDVLVLDRVDAKVGDSVELDKVLFLLSSEKRRWRTVWL